MTIKYSRCKPDSWNDMAIAPKDGRFVMIRSPFGIYKAKWSPCFCAWKSADSTLILEKNAVGWREAVLDV